VSPDSRPADATSPPAIDRRVAVQRVLELLGGTALVGNAALWAACHADRPPSGTPIGAFSVGEVALLDEVAETILPETTTPGAKSARVGAFMAMMVTDTYDAGDQQIFRRGMGQLDAAVGAAGGRSFMAAPAATRLSVLQRLDRQQKAYMDGKLANEPRHYFRMMKELALLGYFTSEIGCTQAQRYIESPGRYSPCEPYVAGTPAWAAHG